MPLKRLVAGLDTPEIKCAHDDRRGGKGCLIGARPCLMLIEQRVDSIHETLPAIGAYSSKADHRVDDVLGVRAPGSRIDLVSLGRDIMTRAWSVPLPLTARRSCIT